MNSHSSHVTVASKRKRGTTRNRTPDAHYLLGPISIRYMKHPKYPHKICLLGDYHNKFGIPCPGRSVAVDQWIKNLVDSNIELDLYLETPFVTKDQDIGVVSKYANATEENYMTDVVKQFHLSCFHHTKTECNINNTRIHYSDFRDRVFTRFPLFDLITDIVESYEFNLKLMSRDGLSLEGLIQSIRNNLGLLQNFTDPNKIREILYDEFVMNKLQKQIDNVRDEYQGIVDVILDDLIRTEDALYQNGKYITEEEMEMISKFDMRNLRQIVSIVYRVSTYYIDRLNMYGDSYILLRIFRSFKNQEDRLNSLIYLGDIHVEYIEQVLRDIGFYVEYEDFSETQCLDIGGLKLFS